MIVSGNVMGRPHQNKPDAMPAMIARRERFPVDTCHLMLFSVVSVVKHFVNSRMWDELGGLEYISDTGHVSASNSVVKL